MQDQVSANLRAFCNLLPSLLVNHRGEHALLHDGEVVGFFERSLDAILVGCRRFGEGNFSVESVNDQPEDLGFFSHVTSTLQA